MKLLSLHIISAQSCGGLLDGFKHRFRNLGDSPKYFEPLCLIGPNGSGKSQLLQLVAEIFQSATHACNPAIERLESNPDLFFEIEYLIRPENSSDYEHVKIFRNKDKGSRGKIVIQKHENSEWINVSLGLARLLLPSKVVAATSGGNETLSFPFLLSRSGYAKEVRDKALDFNDTIESLKKLPKEKLALLADALSESISEETPQKSTKDISEPSLMLIDYSTHLEVFVSNLLAGPVENIDKLLPETTFNELHSFRCIIQLAHPAIRARGRAKGKRKGVQLTLELERHIENLKACSTCYDYNEKDEIYTFDFFVDYETKKAFQFFWENSFSLYSAFHKIALLNDLVIKKEARQQFLNDIKNRRFASRLPEPLEHDRVFRFDRVQLKSSASEEPIDYVALSDGEHQLGLIQGMFMMLSEPNVLFLLDEPESHFNPQWRVQLVQRILDIPSSAGTRREGGLSSEQDCLLTTHSPFVPSDMPRSRVFIFSKEDGKTTVRNPNIETYGTTFDSILEDCFEVRPPISKESLSEITSLLKSSNPEEITAAMSRLGYSVEKAFLAHRLRELTEDRGE